MADNRFDMWQKYKLKGNEETNPKFIRLLVLLGLDRLSFRKPEPGTFEPAGTGAISEVYNNFHGIQTDVQLLTDDYMYTTSTLSEEGKILLGFSEIMKDHLAKSFNINTESLSPRDKQKLISELRKKDILQSGERLDLRRSLRKAILELDRQIFVINLRLQQLKPKTQAEMIEAAEIRETCNKLMDVILVDQAKLYEDLEEISSTLTLEQLVENEREALKGIDDSSVSLRQMVDNAMVSEGGLKNLDRALLASSIRKDLSVDDPKLLKTMQGSVQSILNSINLISKLDKMNQTDKIEVQELKIQGKKQAISEALDQLSMGAANIVKEEMKRIEILDYLPYGFEQLFGELEFDEQSTHMKSIKQLFKSWLNPNNWHEAYLETEHIMVRQSALDTIISGFLNVKMDESDSSLEYYQNISQIPSMVLNMLRISIHEITSTNDNVTQIKNRLIDLAKPYLGNGSPEYNFVLKMTQNIFEAYNRLKNNGTLDPVTIKEVVGSAATANASKASNLGGILSNSNSKS